MTVTTIPKPWGQEEIIEVNDRYCVKRLTMHKGHCCSLQYHERKVETVYLLSGRLNVLIGANVDALSVTVMAPGDSLTLRCGTIHRMEAAEDSVYLEASTPELDDVVRLADNYNRVS